MKSLIYEINGNFYLSKITPDFQDKIPQVISEIVPEGVTPYEIEEEDIPPMTWVDAFEIVDENISINIEKAKTVAQAERKRQAQIAFAPFDTIIQLQIPGSNYDEAELERIKIRALDAELQVAIDNCTTVDAMQALVFGQSYFEQSLE